MPAWLQLQRDEARPQADKTGRVVGGAGGGGGVESGGREV